MTTQVYVQLLTDSRCRSVEMLFALSLFRLDLSLIAYASVHLAISVLFSSSLT